MVDFCEENLSNTNVFNIAADSFNTTDRIFCYISLTQIAVFTVGATGLLIYILIRYCKRKRRCPGASAFTQIKESLQNAVDNSVAVYVSDHPVLRTAFFLLGNFLFLFGSAIFVIVGQMVDNLMQQGQKFFGLAVLTQLSLVIVCDMAFMQLFLFVLIGAKIEVLQYTKNPLKGLTMTTDERKVFVRSSFKRMLVITIIMFLIPQIIEVILTSNDNSTSAPVFMDLLINSLLFYHTKERIPFLRFEKEVLKVQARFGISILKMSCVSNFLKEHGALSVVHAYTSNSPNEDFNSLSSKIKEMALLKANVVEERLELIQNDQSVPMPVNTGEISILGKLLLLLSSLMSIPVFATLISIIDPSHEAWFSNKLFVASELAIMAGMHFLNPFIAIPLFSSHMLFDSKNMALSESIVSQSEEPTNL